MYVYVYLCVHAPVMCTASDMGQQDWKVEPTSDPRLCSKLRGGLGDLSAWASLARLPFSVETLCPCCPAPLPSLVGWWQGVMAGSPENSFFSDAEENFKSKMPGNVSMLGGDAGHCPFPPHQLAFPHLPYPPSCSSLSCLEELGTC